MNPSLSTAALAIAVLSACPVARAGTELGALPPGAVATSSSGPASELIGFLLFDPAAIADRVPTGIRLTTLEEKARAWPRLATYLEKHPDRRAWAWSFFEIIGIEKATYDNVDARFDGGRGGMVVWYPEVRQVDAADDRPIGTQSLAVGSWVSDPELAGYMRSRGFPAMTATVRFAAEADSASGDLAAADLSIHGECRLEGTPFVPSWGKERLSYETFWTAAGEGDTYEIVTWAGHRSRHCRDAQWRVGGTHPFARLFNDPRVSDHDFLPTEFSFGYVLKSALYERTR